jgi:hypothetical protein
MTRPRGIDETRTSCCWIPTRWPSTAAEWNQSLFGYNFGDPDSRNDDDSATSMSKSVVISQVKYGAASIHRRAQLSVFLFSAG